MATSLIREVWETREIFSRSFTKYGGTYSKVVYCSCVVIEQFEFLRGLVYFEKNFNRPEQFIRSVIVVLFSGKDNHFNIKSVI